MRSARRQRITVGAATTLAVLCLVVGQARVSAQATAPVASSQPASAPAAEAPALSPGELTITPTILCAGLYWSISGDTNRNASSTLEYRERGAADWKQAMPFWRMFPQTVDVQGNIVGAIKVDGLSKWKSDKLAYLKQQYGKNYFAGSIFNLKPGTAYEARVTLADPDGGGVARTIEFATRAVPEIPAEGARIEVNGGGDALAVAVAKVEPGQTLVVGKGVYQGFIVRASGTPQKPISIVAAGDGEVIVQGDWPAQGYEPSDRGFARGAGEGIAVYGSHVRIKGLAIRGFGIGIKVGSNRIAKDVTDTAVMQCSISACYDAIVSVSRNGYYADNWIVGIHLADGKVADPRISDDMSEGHGIVMSGARATGNVVCHNTITQVSDVLRSSCSDSDFYGNDGMFNSDDGIETDNGGPNLRIWGNRWLYCGNNGVSFQPYIGGPCYVIANIVHNCRESAIKSRYKSCGAILLNNTFISGGNARRGATDFIEQMYARNNLFITNKKLAVRYRIEDFLRKPCTLDLDHNGYNGALQADPPASFPEVVDHQATRTLSEFRNTFGQERRGIEVTADACFAGRVPTIDEGNKAMTQWEGPIPDFRLAPGSPAIDKGTVIPNIIETFQGAAPDLGAIESGGEPPKYGSRATKPPSLAPAGPTTTRPAAAVKASTGNAP